jgi:tetratricopeptide (TPR) repeat protein
LDRADDHLGRLIWLQKAALDLLREGRFLEVQSCCQQALMLDGENAETAHLIGMLHSKIGQFDHAVEWVSRALRREAKPAYLTTLGTALIGLGRREEAIQAFDKAVQLQPDDADLWWQLGDGLIAAGRSTEALLCFQHTISLNPSHANAAYRAGYLLQEVGRFDEALVELNRSADLQPNHAPTLQVRAVVLKNLKRLEEALADNTRAIALDPTDADTCCNMGNALQALGRHEEALSWYERSLKMRSLKMRSDVASATNITNKAISLAALGRVDEAMASYRLSLSIDPSDAATIWNLSLLQLLTGDFEAGWRGREARWDIPKLLQPGTRPSMPMWVGEQPVAGKTIVVCQYEGMGDAIQFARYVPMLAARGARVILLIDKPLHPLLSTLKGVSQCIAKSPDQVVPPFDLHIAIDSLPLAFGTRLDTIPAERAYLPAPDAHRLRAWEKRLGRREKLRVGLVWSGNPNFGNDSNRSMPFSVLSEILDLDATFVSLQKDPRPQDLEALRQRPDVVDLTGDLTDFAETAALVCCLDLVITVDTGVAHLAAALGRPTWILLPYVPDWRWFLDRDDSPWYPTARLFRQSATREYGSVLRRLRAELTELINARRSAGMKDGPIAD